MLGCRQPTFLLTLLVECSKQNILQTQNIFLQIFFFKTSKLLTLQFLLTYIAVIIPWYILKMRIQNCKNTFYQTFKGQLISKGLFAVLNSPQFFQKPNEQILLYYDILGRIAFVRFLEDTKKTFLN